MRFEVNESSRNKWISLLWAEQLQIEIDIRNYDLHDIYLKQRSSFAQNGGLFQYVDFVISFQTLPSNDLMSTSE